MLGREIASREKVLEQEFQQVKLRLAKSPSGTVFSFNDRSKTRFYKCIKGKRYYLGKKDKEEVQALLQKKYDTLLSAAIKKEYQYLKSYLDFKVPEVLNEIPEKFRSGIITGGLTGIEYAQRWQSKNYKTLAAKEILPFYTSRGEHVRSKSEVIIADSLFNAGVPYHYEAAIQLDDELRYPDFYVLNKRTGEDFIWEHFGMMDQSEYCKEAIKKISVYAACGYYMWKNMIVTMENSQQPLDTKYIHTIIEKLLT